MNKRLVPSAALVVCMVASLAMAGIAYGASKSRSGSVQAGVSKKQKAKRGPRGKRGPAGSQGSQGLPGSKGSDGARGPSNGYQASDSSEVALTTSFTTIGSLAVPAGSYLVSAKLWGYNTASSRALLECQLTNSENSDDDRALATLEPIGATAWFGRSTLAMHASSTLTAAGVWSVECLSSPAGVTVDDLKIQALQVASLTNSST
jgi:hypothetical protein